MESLSENEMRVLNAVQLAPRASWAQLGQALDLDAATVARRWSRLVSAGSAWLSAYPGPGAGHRLNVSFIEVNCVTNKVLSVAEALATDPRVVTIEHVTGSRDLVLTVATAGLEALSEFLLHGISQIAGVSSTQTQPGTRIFVEGGDWQLRSLDIGEQGRIERNRPRTTDAPALVSDRSYRELLGLLAEDARMGVSELADRLGVSRPTARRRIEGVLARREIVVRCDVPHGLTRWPVSATLWADVPPEQHADVARTLSDLPETRLTVGLTGGAANLMISLWMRGLEDLQRLETILAERVPGIRIVERAVALRHIKRVGALLGPHGRAIGHVPVDPWFGVLDPL